MLLKIELQTVFWKFPSVLALGSDDQCLYCVALSETSYLAFSLFFNFSDISYWIYVHVIPRHFFNACIGIMMVCNCHCDHFFLTYSKSISFHAVQLNLLANKKAVEWQNYFRNVRSAKSDDSEFILFSSCCLCCCFFVISRPICLSNIPDKCSITKVKNNQIAVSLESFFFLSHLPVLWMTPPVHSSSSFTWGSLYQTVFCVFSSPPDLSQLFFCEPQLALFHH